jgi:hypothetical protein
VGGAGKKCPKNWGERESATLELESILGRSYLTQVVFNVVGVGLTVNPIILKDPCRLILQDEFPKTSGEKNEMIFYQSRVP